MNEDTSSEGPAPAPFTALRRFVRPRAPVERCELCSAEIVPDPDHQHLLDPATRQLLCVCDPCAILFSTTEGRTPYRRLPRRVRHLHGFALTDAQWDDLLIPVGMAFFFYNSAEARIMAYYPSPAGPTESLLPLESWQELVRANPILAEIEPDVEALLVNRLKGEQDYYLTPIDRCYELVGLIRLNWRGLSGGTEVWQQIGAFFHRLQTGALSVTLAPVAEPPDAHA